MQEVYTNLTNAQLQDIESMKEIVARIAQQTLECSYFIREYAQNDKFRMSIIRIYVNERNPRDKE